MPSTNNKDKPWDTDDIDKWKIEEFKPEDNVGGAFRETSTFKLMFPRYREAYLRASWPLVVRALAPQHITPTLDLIEGSMTVATTLRTFDPAAILKARDLIKLLARSVPVEQAARVLEDGMAMDVIEIGKMVRNRDKFKRRRQRLVGPAGETQKALGLLTGCSVWVQGNTVAALGSYAGLKEVRRVAEDCMNNIHPVYHIKELMIKRELRKDPTLAHESWDRFLPHFRKRTLAKRKKPAKITDKSQKVYTPFPPAPEKSKVDLQIESGEFFLDKGAKARAARQEREEQRTAKKEQRRKEREKDFVAPDEDAGSAAGTKRKRDGETKEEREERKRKKKLAKAAKAEEA